MDDFGFPEIDSINPLLFTLLPFGIFVGIICFVMICLYCCCRARTANPESSSVQPTQVSPSLPPVFIPTMPTAPPPARFEDPPPYSEIAFKPNIWPQVEQPPSYINVAMEGLPTPDGCHIPTPAQR